MDRTNTYVENAIKVASKVHVRKLYGYLPSFVCAPRNTCVTPMTVRINGFPCVVLDLHRRWEQPLPTACFTQLVKKFQASLVRTRVIFECLWFPLALVGEGILITLSSSIASIIFWASGHSKVNRCTRYPVKTKTRRMRAKTTNWNRKSPAGCIACFPQWCRVLDRFQSCRQRPAGTPGSRAGMVRAS